ncbi:glycosyltransferase [Jannaschia sp. LMIT008]|uniref:glycosyltransferase n=1 Tax=Jannaschia maritima TaxID=3032585 RepID=UPI0028118EA0|nr:glycosyltransferase [Jannaschia sp. LMIT008]
MIAPIAWRCPPAAYGPWESATSTLTEALVTRGHDVTLFAASGSRTAGRLHVTAPHPYEEAPLDVKVWEAMHLGAAARLAAEGVFDVVHAQCDFPALPFAPILPVPMVVTLHGLGPPEVREATLPIWRAYADAAHYVAISDADRDPSLRYAATIHHGIDPSRWPPADPGPDAPLAFFARSHPEKGPGAAIAAARAAGRPLRMAGIVADPDHHRAAVEPWIDGDRVQWLGPLAGAARARFLGGASALLHLIAFDEPFGLSVAEAMMCGTPVVATRRGSMPEIVEDGVTGVLVDHPDEAPAAIARAVRIDRRRCAARARERFSAATMAARYEALYASVVAASPVPRG